MALKQTLDAQIARKEVAKREALRGEMEQQQHALNCVALEMQEQRSRDQSSKQEQQDVLTRTWKLQKQLKQMEATVDKATLLS